MVNLSFAVAVSLDPTGLAQIIGILAGAYLCYTKAKYYKQLRKTLLK